MKTFGHIPDRLWKFIFSKILVLNFLIFTFDSLHDSIIKIEEQDVTCLSRLDHTIPARASDVGNDLEETDTQVLDNMFDSSARPCPR